MYRSPVSEIGFTLKHVAEFDRVAEAYGGDELSDDLVEAILEEAGRFAAEEIAPLNPVADMFCLMPEQKLPIWIKLWRQLPTNRLR